MSWERLTEQEKKHLEANGCKSWDEMVVLFNAQRILRKRAFEEPCYECRAIAERFDLEV